MWGQCGKVELKDIRLMDRDVCIVAKAEGQLAGKRGIELNAMQPSAARCEQTGDGSVAGADFNDCALRDIADSIRDAQTCVFVYEEVLAELGFLCHYSMVAATARCGVGKDSAQGFRTG